MPRLGVKTVKHDEGEHLDLPTSLYLRCKLESLEHSVNELERLVRQLLLRWPSEPGPTGDDIPF